MPYSRRLRLGRMRSSRTMQTFDTKERWRSALQGKPLNSRLLKLAQNDHDYHWSAPLRMKMLHRQAQSLCICFCTGQKPSTIATIQSYLGSVSALLTQSHIISLAQTVLDQSTNDSFGPAYADDYYDSHACFCAGSDTASNHIWIWKSMKTSITSPFVIVAVIQKTSLWTS